MRIAARCPGRWLVPAGLCALTAAVYAQVAGHLFVALDDPALVFGNARVAAGLTREGAAWALTATAAFNWHPLTWLSHMIDVSLFGMAPGPHHLVSVALHALNAILLYRALAGSTGRIPESALAAALFAVHPLHVESVAWVAERKDVLSGLFFFLCVGAYARYARRPGAARYALVCALFALGLAAKPMVVTLPFVLLLLDWWPLGRFAPAREAQAPWRRSAAATARRLVLEKVPLLLLSAASCAVTYLAQAGGGAVAGFELFPAPVRAANALISYAAYLGQAVWPASLSVFYPHPGAGISVAAAGGAALLVAAATLAAVRYRARAPYAAVGWLFFLGTLVPVIGIVQIGLQARADRYSYLPLVGLFVAASWGFGEFAGRKRFGRALFVAGAAAAVAALAVASWRQAGYWKDGVSLFTRALETTTGNWLAHDSLGVELAARGRADEAAGQFREAIRIRPAYPLAHYNLAVVLERQGSPEEAIAHYREAIRLKPDYSEAHANLGAALHRKGRIDEAIGHYVLALRANPEDAVARRNLEMAIAATGRSGGGRGLPAR